MNTGFAARIGTDRTKPRSVRSVFIRVAQPVKSVSKILVVVFLASFQACTCRPTDSISSMTATGSPTKGLPAQVARSFALDRKAAADLLAELTRSPHPFGSDRQAVVADLLVERAKAHGLAAYKQEFWADAPNPAAGVAGASPMLPLTVSRRGINVYARAGVAKNPPCVVLLGSHFDTKIVTGIDYVGANDSGSSSVAIMQILAALRRGNTAVQCDIAAVWLDGEEATLPGWDDGQYQHPARIQDNTYGSRWAADHLERCGTSRCLPAELGGGRLVAFILLDMVGSPGLRLTDEAESSAELWKIADEALKTLQLGNLKSPPPRGITDDHVAFLRAGVPALDLIDYEHLEVWHRDGDEAARVSWDSVEQAARIALFTALTAGSAP